MNVFKYIMTKKSSNPLYISSFSGIKFEHFTKDLLKNLGFEDVQVTKPTRDFGIDVIGTLNNMKIGIQCKHLKHVKKTEVGYRAIEEADAGKDFYNLDKAIVLTNSTFSKSAMVGARRIGIETWDYKILNKLFNKSKFGSIQQKPKEKFIIKFTHILGNHKSNYSKSLSRHDFNRELKYVHKINGKNRDGLLNTSFSPIKQFVNNVFLKWNVNRIPSTFTYNYYKIWAKSYGYKYKISEKLFVSKISNILRNRYVFKTSRIRYSDSKYARRIFSHVNFHKSPLLLKTFPRPNDQKRCIVKIH